MWAFGLDQQGSVIVGSHDLAARRAGEAPTFMWIPDRGQVALGQFLGAGSEAGVVP